MIRTAKVRLAGLDEADACRHLLSDAEAQRAGEIKNEAVRKRFILSRSLRRELLSECLGGPPSVLDFIEDKEGKPRLVDPGRWDFNVSHAGDYVVVAVDERPVGVDLEMIREVREMAAIVQRYFHRDEAAAWATLAEPLCEEAFFVLWSAREAAMKCVGLGLAGGMEITRVEPTIMSDREARAMVGAQVVALQRLDAPPGYVMVLAAG
jgi:4'-phosphopantetheinyl transferase